MKNLHLSFFLLFYRDQYLFKNRPTDGPPNSFYRSLYPKIIQDIEVCFFKYYFVSNVLDVVKGKRKKIPLAFSTVSESYNLL